MIKPVVKSALSVAGVAQYVGTRVFPTTFKQKDGGLPAWPSIMYWIVSAIPPEDVCGTGDGSTDDTRVQIEIVANTDRERTLIVTAVRAAMQDLDPPASLDTYLEDYNDQTRTYRAIMDYIFYPSSEESS